jgi:hypothetical protein
MTVRRRVDALNAAREDSVEKLRGAHAFDTAGFYPCGFASESTLVSSERGLRR